MDTPNAASNLYTIHQSPLEDGPHHPPVATGYVTNMVTYVTHPSSGHCGWSIAMQAAILFTLVTTLCIFISYSLTSAPVYHHSMIMYHHIL